MIWLMSGLIMGRPNFSDSAFDDVALLYQPHFDQKLAYALRASPALALDFAGGHHVVLRYQPARDQQVAHAHVVPVAAYEFVQPRVAYKIHFEQDFGKRFLPGHVLVNLAGLRELLVRQYAFGY